MSVSLVTTNISVSKEESGASQGSSEDKYYTTGVSFLICVSTRATREHKIGNTLS